MRPTFWQWLAEDWRWVPFGLSCASAVCALVALALALVVL